MGQDDSAQAVMLVLDRITDGVYTLDREWRFTAINRAAEAYIGQPREAMLGKVLWDAFPQLAGTRVEEEYRAAVATQEPREFELLTPVHQRWVEARVFPSVDGLSVYFIDVTTRKQAEEAVRASEARYRTLFEHTLDGIQLTAPDGQILDSNPAACRMLQRTREEITAAGRGGILDTADPRLAVLLEQRRVHGHARGEVTFVRKDGTRFPAEVSSVVFTDADNNLRTSLSFRDLTETKRGETALRALAEASAHLQRSLDLDVVLAELADVVVPALAELVVIDLVDGGALRRIVSQRREDGDPRLDVLRRSAPDHAVERGVSRVLSTGESELVPIVTDEWLQQATRDEAHLAAARALAPSSILMVPIIGREQLLGVLSLIQLDSGRRFGEADLPVARGLADRAALAIDNAQHYRDAVEARERRDEMLGIVSHDLRTPLNAIQLQAQLIARRHPTVDIGPIRASVAHANRLVQDLLTISAIESGKLPLDRRHEDLADILGEVVALHGPIADKREVTLHLDCVPELGRVFVDRHRFAQALANLIANAIKFTSAGGRVDVRARRGSGETIIEVSDTGIGIPAENLPRLFERFWRGHHKRQGVGLGLSITKGVIDAHGGQLTVRSELGAGATFTIRLPFSANG